MKTITTNVGVLYMEKEDEREEADRIKIYDSQKRYLEYLPLASVSENSSITSYCNEVAKRLEECDSIDEMLKYLGIEAYTVGTSWTDLLEDIYGLDNYEYDSSIGKYILVADGTEITEQTVLSNEYVNIIGAHYVLNCE